MTYNEAIAEARDRGRSAGHALRASILAEDGCLDCIADWSPGWLSGEWAGESTRELLGDILDERPDDDFSDICGAYESAADDAFYSEGDE